jgi:hypothetical protein
MTHSQCLYTVLDSSLLKAAAYSPDQTLELQFRSGAVYRYFSVPAPVFEDLIIASSKGNYFNRNVRMRFRYQRVA